MRSNTAGAVIFRGAVLAAAGLLLACEASRPPVGDEPLRPPERTVFGGERPVTLMVPEYYDHAEPTPLIVLLHGYSANGLLQTYYLGLDALVDEVGVLVAAPNGTADSQGNLFWNATDACCNFAGADVDDVAYVSGLVEEISGEYNVDPARVFLVGHSNGGFMSFRLGCERADLFAAVVSIAGATWEDPSRCSPSRPVSVLQIHGDGDDVILYEGGRLFGATHPGARATIEAWAGYNGCQGSLETSADRLDLEPRTGGAETRVERVSGCPADGAAELWTLEGGSHIPAFGPAFRSEMWRWLSSRARR